jgi:hypothetical protein
MTKPQYEKPRIDVLVRQPASIRPLLEDAIREAQIKMLLSLAQSFQRVNAVVDSNEIAEALRDAAARIVMQGEALIHLMKMESNR